MLPSTALLLLAPLPLAFGQYGGGAAPLASPSPSSASPATTTGSSAVAIQTVTVGQNGLTAFVPNTTVAAPGTQIEFIFYPAEHSVVQGAFDAPCKPINDSGFYSGGFTTSSPGPNVSSSISKAHQSRKESWTGS
jgi:plastocyanin